MLEKLSSRWWSFWWPKTVIRYLCTTGFMFYNKQMDVLGTLSTIVGISGAIFLVPALSEHWYRPVFSFGILPQDHETVADELCAKPDERLDFSSWKPAETVNYKCKNMRVRIPIIVANTGRGDAKDTSVLIEYWDRNIIVEDICTEYLQIQVAFGPKNHFTCEHLANKTPEDKIVDYYNRIGMTGIFLELTGSMPSNTYEIILFDLLIGEPREVKFKISVRTPARRFQQRSVEQCIMFGH